MKGRHLRVIALSLAMAVTAAACATGVDTTAVDEDPVDRATAPTSTIVRTERATSTTTTVAPARAVTASTTGGDPTAVLGSILAKVAADPALAGQLSQLDAVGIANLLNIDLPDLQSLGLTPDQLAAVAQGLVTSTPSIQQNLLSGLPDPGVLLGLLAGSLDPASLTNGSAATLLQALLAAVTGTQIVVSPELAIDLGELLGELDPEKLGPIVANPANASLLALVTSVWLSTNPLLAQQLLADPQLNPALRDLLSELQALSASIGETARAALLEALYGLIPALGPTS